MPSRSPLLEMHDDMRQWRHWLHAHPETAFQEIQTCEYVAKLLTDWGLPLHRGLAGTGVVATLKVGTSPRVIGLRADMDALDLDERNHFPHRSQTPGKMHACGHDGHTAMLLGAARYLSTMRRFDGTVHFIFQPAEENEAGGRRMIQEGLFDLFPVDSIYGLHNMPTIPEGCFVVRAGPMMASADFFDIKITGRGTHGAWPHKGIDAIAIASEIVLAFNHIAARTVDPLEAAVISVTQFHAGQTHNVLPESALLSGTTRTFSTAIQDQLESRMRQLCGGIASAHGATVDFTYERRYPPTVNHPAESAFAAEVARRVVGSAQVLKDEAPVMGAEDFGWMLQERPGCYAWLGSGRENAHLLHTPDYDFNDRILPVGASYWVELVESALRTDEPSRAQIQSSG